MTDETQVDVPVTDAPAAPGAEVAGADAPVAAAAAGAPAATAAAPAASAPAAAPAAVAPAPPRPSKGRAMSRVGQVVGIVGIVLSLVLAVGSITGSLWLTGQIGTLAAEVDSRIAEAQPKLDALDARISEVKATVDDVVAVADAAAQVATPGDGVLATLQERLGGLSSRYAGLRNAYSDVREKVTGALAGLQVLERIIPGFQVPQEPLDALNGLDAKVQELDAGISGILDTKFDGGTLRDVAATVAEKIGMVSGGLDKVLGVIDEVGVRVTDARAEIASLASQISTYVTLGGALVTLLFLYMAFLHWVLFRTSRSAGRTG